jgi:hypothetical protein
MFTGSLANQILAGSLARMQLFEHRAPFEKDDRQVLKYRYWSPQRYKSSA